MSKTTIEPSERTKITQYQGLEEQGSYFLIAVLTTAVLWTSAMTKTFQLSTEIVSSQKGFLILLVESEWLLGLFLLSGVARKSIWLLSVSFFSLLGLVSLYQMATGVPTCGCFGALDVPPGSTFLLDVVMILLLLQFRPAREHRPVKRSLRLRAVMIAFLVTGLPAGYAMITFRPALLTPDGLIEGTAEKKFIFC